MNKIAFVLLSIFAFTSNARADLCDLLLTNSFHFVSMTEYGQFLQKYGDDVKPNGNPMHDKLRVFPSVKVDFRAEDVQYVEAFVEGLDFLAKQGVLKELLLIDKSWTDTTPVTQKIAAEMKKYPDLLQALESFRLLRLSNDNLMNEALNDEFLDHLPNLKNINFGDMDFTSAFFSRVAARVMNQNGKLNQITFGSLTLDETQNLVALLPLKDRIQSMGLDKTSFNDPDKLALLKQFTNVTMLSVDGIDLRHFDRTPNAVQELTNAFPKLERLVIHSNKNMIVDRKTILEEDLDLLPQFSTLKYLYIETTEKNLPAFKAKLEKLFKGRDGFTFTVVAVGQNN